LRQPFLSAPLIQIEKTMPRDFGSRVEKILQNVIYPDTLQSVLFFEHYYVDETVEDAMAEDVVRIDKMKKCVQKFGREN
jgi:hypothetical protein